MIEFLPVSHCFQCGRLFELCSGAKPVPGMLLICCACEAIHRLDANLLARRNEQPLTPAEVGVIGNAKFQLRLAKANLSKEREAIYGHRN